MREHMAAPKRLYRNTLMSRYEGERWEHLLPKESASAVDWALWAACSAGIRPELIVEALDSLTERAMGVPNPRAETGTDG